MFYYIVSKFPLIMDTTGGGFIKIFISGTICYLLVHLILFSNIGMKVELFTTYRNYLYYIWGLDLVLAWWLSKGSTSEIEEIDEVKSEELSTSDHSQKSSSSSSDSTLSRSNTTKVSKCENKKQENKEQIFTPQESKQKVKVQSEPSVKEEKEVVNVVVDNDNNVALSDTNIPTYN